MIQMEEEIQYYINTSFGFLVENGPKGIILNAGMKKEKKLINKNQCHSFLIKGK